MVTRSSPDEARFLSIAEPLLATPAGRTFREWAAIDPGRLVHWPSLLDEALAFVAAK